MAPGLEIEPDILGPATSPVLAKHSGVQASTVF